MADEKWPVLVARTIPDDVMARLKVRADVTLYDGPGAIPRDQLLAEVHGKRAAVTILTDKVDDEFLDAAGPQLAIVANYAVGFDNMNLPAMTAHGVMATNTPDVLTETTADLAWSLMMAAARRVPEGNRLLREQRPWIWAPLMMLGQDVHHKTLGIVGFGRIGQAVARRGHGFGMKVLYYDVYRPSPEVEQELNAEYRDIDDLLKESDFVSLHTNLTPETRHLINAERLAEMKPTAVIVNTSRGPVIDEEALAHALRDGVIFAAGLDVFEKEPEVHPLLLELENAVVIPHLGSATVDTRRAMGMLVVDNIFAAMDGQRPPTLLNPEVLDHRPSAPPTT
jgi:glyoxylate reductase